MAPAPSATPRSRSTPATTPALPAAPGAPVVFNQVALTDSSVVFENPKHGYPQKIGYRRDGDNSLSAWIEGSRNGVSRRFEFPYRQVVCAGSA